MQSDAKVPDPAPRGLTVPAGAVVVLMLTGAIWGVGLFLLGRQTAPPVEVLDRASVSYLASLNRIDQALVKGDETEITRQIATAVLPDDPLGRTALELRRARVTELAVARKAREAEEAAKRAAAMPEAVLKRLRANLWPLGMDLRLPIIGFDAPVTETTKTEDGKAAEIKSLPGVTLSVRGEKPVAFNGETIVPDALITHPGIVGRMYATTSRGLIRSDDHGQTWRAGLAPLQEVKGGTMWFTVGDHPLLGVIGSTTWLFNDAEAAFFP